MPKLKFDDLFKEYPYAGRIKKIDQDRGFGIINNDGSNRENFAHFSCRKIAPGKPSGTDLIEKQCLFAIGFTPNRKEQSSCVLWITEDEIEGNLSDYTETRKSTIASWDNSQLVTALKATWYSNQIWKGHSVFPKMPTDQILLSETERRLASPTNINEYMEILTAKANSQFNSKPNSGKLIQRMRNRQLLNEQFDAPIHPIEESPDATLRRGLEALVSMHPFLFKGLSASEFSSFLAKVGPDNTDLFLPLAHLVFVGQSIALDIESDGKNLFQVGYASREWSELIGTEGGASTDPQSACRKLEETIGPNWMVGHNLIEWDLPILIEILKPKTEKKIYHDFSQIQERSQYSRGYGIWDTLVISILLAPWKATHALTTSTIAHRADSDAEATLRLFEEQAKAIPLDFVRLLKQPSKATPLALLEQCALALTQKNENSHRDPPGLFNCHPSDRNRDPMYYYP